MSWATELRRDNILNEWITLSVSRNSAGLPWANAGMRGEMVLLVMISNGWSATNKSVHYYPFEWQQHNERQPVFIHSFIHFDCN